MKLEVTYPGLCYEKTPSGRPRWRVRVDGDKGRKITIPVAPDHESFSEHYRAARLGHRLLKTETILHPPNGSLDEMCSNYLAWMEKQVAAGNLSQLTLNSRRTGLSQACNCLSPKGFRIGQLSADLPRAAFVAIRDSFSERTGAADTCLKALRALYTWGVDYGYPENCPVFEVKSGHKSKGGAVPWSLKDKASFLDEHGPGSMARLWFYLARDTAGRTGDTHRLGKGHLTIEGDTAYLSWQPSKSGSKPVKIPMSQEFLNELSALETDAPTFLLTEYGTPFASSGSLDNRVRKWVISAGLCTVSADADGNEVLKATRSQHGLRKARAVEIAEHGGTEYEVMAALSHSEPKTTARYTEEVRRTHLTESAIKRIHGAEKAKSVPPTKNRGTPLTEKSVKTMLSGNQWQSLGESNPSFQVENLAS